MLKKTVLTLAVGLLGAIALSAHAEDLSLTDLKISIQYACPRGWEDHSNRAQFVSGEDVWLDDIPDFAAFIRYTDDNFKTSAGDYKIIHSLIAPEVAAYECALNKQVLYTMALAEASDLGAALNNPPVDTDGDGVNDAIDLCLNTALGQVVNVQGCSDPQLLGDDDDDGVANTIDDCPLTPQDQSADADGCSTEQLDTIDSDGDGTPDYLDAYPQQGLGYCPAI